jgi:hypothetical protein
MEAMPTGDIGLANTEKRSLRRWAMVVILFGAVERACMWVFYRPIAYGDTPSYLRLAEEIARLSLRGYDGTRTPAYPALMAILGGDPRRIMLTQLIMGWLISIMFLWIAWKMTGSANVAGSVAVAYDLLLPLVLFEANLIAEASTTFWIVLSFVLLVFIIHNPEGAGSLAAAFSLGVTASLAGLTRPLFYVLPVWLLPFVWSAAGGPVVRRLTKTTLYCVGPIILLGGWLLYIYQSYDMLSPTTMGGYQLVQHTGAFFEYLPDDSAGIRDTYLKYRDAKIAETGAQANAIWDAIPEMTQVSGLSFYGLSAELARLSFLLIREHPALYFRSVVEGWIWFWKAPAYWKPEAFLDGARAVLRGWVALGRSVELLANAGFLAISAAMLVSSRLRRRIRLSSSAAAVGGSIWLISIVQTLADHGDNPRFLVPLEMSVILFVTWSVWTWSRSGSPRSAIDR